MTVSKPETALRAADSKKLQRLIDKAAKTSTAYFLANAELMQFCRERYGCEPGDVDADDIIDAVLGGCGTSNGMAAVDFDRVMRERSNG